MLPVYMECDTQKSKALRYLQRNVEEKMYNEPFFQQAYLKECLTKEARCGELLRTLYIKWLDTKDEELFLVLYTYAWFFADDVYCDSPEKFYDENTYEKELFFELLEYGKKYLQKNVKFMLLTGYIYNTTWHYFGGNMDYDCEEIEEEGKRIILDLYNEYPESLGIKCFYGMLYGFKKACICDGKEEIKEVVYELFPSNSQIDMYFREILERSIA